MTQNALKTFRFVRLALMAGVGFPLILASNAFAQLPAPAVPAEPGAPPPSTAEVERVVVTGSNIPTAEETGPNPVDTYRPQDIEKLGIRNATDLQEFIPQQAGGTVNLNIGNGGDGTVQFNLRGLLPKETLILIDGKRVANGSLDTAGASSGPDINLIPFSMVDHVDILKDGASAVYGSDAIAGVVNFFLVHKFRGLEIGGTYGNTDLGASNDMGEWEAWIKAGTGDDKTDIVVIADSARWGGAGGAGVFLRFPGQWTDSILTNYSLYHSGYSWRDLSSSRLVSPDSQYYFSAAPYLERRIFAPPAGMPFPQIAPVGLSMESSMGSSEIADQPYAKVVCDCNNKGFKWIWVDPPLEPYRGCIAPCAAVHENDHIQWLKRYRPHSCDGRKDGDNPNITEVDKNCTECSAYKASINCIRQALARASQSGMGSYCQFVLRNRELPDQEDQQHRFCKGCKQ